MVCVVHDCNCDTCPGTTHFPPRADGQMLFGGLLCNCRCHDLIGYERIDFIKMKNKLEGKDDAA